MKMISFSNNLKILFFFFTGLSLVPYGLAEVVSYDERISIKLDKIHVGPRYKSEGNGRVTLIDIQPLRDIKPRKCVPETADYCLEWVGVAEFKITPHSDRCEKFQFKTERNVILSSEFNLTGLHLYGGAERSTQVWPIGQNPMNNMPHVSTHKIDDMAVLENYWLDSGGQYVYVYDYVPLFVTYNEDILKISSNKIAPYVRNDSHTVLDFMLCTFDNAKLAQMDAINRFFAKPTATVDYRAVELPIWTTWAVYKTNISESIVQSYADNILKHGMPISQLEIDDKWETCYGSLIVDKKRFPNMKAMVEKLKQKGFKVTIWTHPFINLDCEPQITFAKQMGFLVRGNNDSVNTTWWNGDAAMIDFTNPAAYEWFLKRLENFKKETGIDSFKFDAGESTYSPQVSHYHLMTEDHPELNLKKYIDMTSKFGNIVEVRTARGTQKYPIFLRINDLNSKWKGKHSFATLIPTLLFFNIIGYPFVLPDMIGGNVYDDDVLTEELFIRMLQASVFMPSLQFSIPPWQFSDKIVQLTKKFIDLHIKYSPKIHDLMIESTKSGKPVNLPLWWLDPKDEVALTIDSEFLLGEDILVAPVVEQGATSRNIYLPIGTWRDENNPKAPLIKGPTWLHNYKTDLETLPYFTKVSEGSGANFNSPSFYFIIVTSTIGFLLFSFQ